MENRQFQVTNEGSKSPIHPITAGVPQGSVLAPYLYSIFTADIPTTNATEIATFADDTAIMGTNSSQAEATNSLQIAVNKVEKWADSWKIKLSEQKTVQVTFALRNKDSQYRIHLNGTPVKQEDSTKYLGIHLDSKLIWREHIKQKSAQIRLKIREMNWLIGKHSKLKLENKLLIYRAIIRPIWSYGCELWGCAKSSNRQIIQRIQNHFVRMIAKAYRYTSNADLHKDLKLESVDEIIQKRAIKYELRLLKHPNIEAIQLLDVQQDTRRLKRRKPHELAYE